MNSIINFLSAGVAFPLFPFLFHFPVQTLPMGLGLCSFVLTAQQTELSRRVQDNPEGFELVGSITQQRAEPLLYDAVPCQEIWGPHLCGRNHPFFARKVLFLRSLFPPGWSLCLVILPQEAPWGVHPMEKNHPDRWAELILPSAQGEELILSLCFSPGFYDNKREGDTIKGALIRKPVPLGSSCAGAQGLQKTLQIWSLLRSPRLPSWVTFLSPLTPDRPLGNWPPKSAEGGGGNWHMWIPLSLVRPFPYYPGILKPWSHQ